MPRKPEPSFKLKKIIWDLAATTGAENLAALCKDLDYELEQLRKNKNETFSEDTPDIRTVRRIVELDINRLPSEVVVSKLPPHVWRLRDDYEAIKQLAEAEKLEVQDFKQEEKITGVARRPEHEEHLRAIISYLIKSLPDLSSPSMPLSPEAFVLPEGGLAYMGIENDPVFQALMEHLKDTVIPKLWRDLEIAKHEYFVANAPLYSIESSDPEFVRKEQHRIEALRSTKDAIWQRYDSLTISLWQKLKELSLLDRLPGRCTRCPDCPR